MQRLRNGRQFVPTIRAIEIMPMRENNSHLTVATLRANFVPCGVRGRVGNLHKFGAAPTIVSIEW